MTSDWRTWLNGYGKDTDAMIRFNADWSMTQVCSPNGM
jgi:hypothetical protein